MMYLKIGSKKLDMYKKIVEDNINHNFKSYKDPDTRIEHVVELNGRKYRLGPDGICGIKYLQEKLNDINIVKKYYRCIRSKILLWPRHTNSINIKRYRLFRDRIDFTLYEIQKYYIENKSILVDNEDFDYFDSFGNGEKGFSIFINEFGLEMFVNKDNKVLNLGNEKMGPIESSTEYDNPVKNQFYLNNLYKVLRNDDNTVSSKS